MTVRDYISIKLRAFDVSEAHLVDMSVATGLSPELDVDGLDPSLLAIALIRTLEDLILAPRQNSISESGFSMSWNFDAVVKYYQWLCRKWNVEPDADVVELSGLNTIKDCSNRW